MAEEFSRPDPEKLLEKIQAQQRSQARGRLKVFLGYAAGVGKTYAMLEAAHQRLAEGADAVVGYVETHGRAETEMLLRGLEVIPRHDVEYHGVHVTEMDIDAILARQPRLAVVDELATRMPLVLAIPNATRMSRNCWSGVSTFTRRSTFSTSRA